MRNLFILTVSAAALCAGAALAQTLPADVATSAMASAPQARNTIALAAGGGFSNLDTGFSDLGPRGVAAASTNAGLDAGVGTLVLFGIDIESQFSPQRSGDVPETVDAPVANNSGLLGLESTFAVPDLAGNPALK